MRRWDREGRDATRQCHLEWSASMSESGPSCRSSKELGSAHFPRVEDFARIELVTPSELLDLAWSYPLLEALYGAARGGSASASRGRRGRSATSPRIRRFP